MSVTRLLGEDVLSVSVWLTSSEPSMLTSWDPSLLISRDPIISDRHWVEEAGHGSGEAGSPFTSRLLELPASGSTSSNGVLLESTSNFDLLSSCLRSSSMEN